MSDPAPMRIIGRLDPPGFADTAHDFDPNSEPTQRELVDVSGGPCECGCHYDDEDRGYEDV